jgi:hypothetical protein
MRCKFHCASVCVFAVMFTAEVLATQPADQLRADVRDALQGSMRVSKENREAVVHRLIDLYGQLATAASLTDADRMQAQVRARLLRLSTIINRQMEIDAITAGAAPRANASQADDARRPLRVRQPPAHEVLAQQFAPPGRPAAAAGAFRQVGGFGRQPAIGVGANRAAFPAQPPDNGQALVDLIRRTIAPASWNVNGGQGAIVYFRPSRVLVVRQRSEVHEQLQGVVRALRQ